MTYFMYINNGYASDADTEQEARDEATAWYIEQLQRGEIEFFIEDED